MAEINITGGGQSARADSAAAGAAESSSHAFAHAEGSSAPITGQGRPEADGATVGEESVARTPDLGEAGLGTGSDGAEESRDGAGATAAGARAHAGGARAPDTTADAIEGELDELVETAKQRDDYLALAQRTQADFENYRKRVARDAAAARDRGVGSLAKELLPALDNLDRALDGAADDDPLLQGVRLVRNELKAALARAGIESFCPLGEAFDPAVHEAVATAPQADGGSPSGSVVEVYQDGYRLGESILRPARVVVAA
jgi:molecular chaperone GrpE